ncbi:hypothetical protein ACTFIZ_000187, partial [Dictyostelium cf. discoideum]
VIYLQKNLIQIQMFQQIQIIIIVVIIIIV